MGANLRYRPQLPSIVADELDSFAPGLTRDILGSVQSTDLQDARGWTAVPYAAGLFTGSAGMTWTVDRADVVLFKWRKLGTSVVVKLVLTGTSVGGVVTPTLQVTIPNAMTAAEADVTGLGAYNDNAAGWVSGARISVPARGSTLIQIQKANLTTNWTAAANTTEIAFQFEFQVQ